MEEVIECGGQHGHPVFTVAVRNELTGEVVSVRAPGMSARDAQEQALIHLFEARGWRKARAFPPGPANGL